MRECWSNGVVEYRNAGVLERWVKQRDEVDEDWWSVPWTGWNKPLNSEP